MCVLVRGGEERSGEERKGGAGDAVSEGCMRRNPFSEWSW